MHPVSLEFVIHCADNALILGHRNSEWTGHGPILEQDIALSNISLDLIGQARNFYQYAAELIGGGATEDSLAFLRTSQEFTNCLMVEQENGDWGKTVVRQFLFSSYQFLLFNQKFDDAVVNAIAEKSLKEVAYHLRWSSEWTIRLGDGTQESKRRITTALNELWPFSADMVPASMYADWKHSVDAVLRQAELTAPENVKMMTGGSEGRHTSALEKLLEEMQFMQRTYPNLEW